MKITELFELICPKEFRGIKVKSEEVMEVKDISGKYMMSFCVLDENERILYQNSLEKEKFTGTSEYLKFYDIDVDDFFELLKENKQLKKFSHIMKTLRKYKNVPESYLLIAHMILHEIGHYKQYIERGKNVYEYISWCINQEEDLWDEKEKIVNKIRYRIEQGIAPEYPNKLERYELEKIDKKYREIAKEKEADDFAHKSMKDIIDILQEINICR